ncbi:4'-phosphopantetheinyl transferase superfamily protein [Streptomyces sp. NPDC051776]|uniref:4'-phosphopantetheinyl transferase superfamily protein n=1 Tax=Streptomyces sp. NPDC051776 TaxID=3155414 RepID=UPI003436666E
MRVPVLAVRTDRPLEEGSLSPGERGLLDALPAGAQRRRQWLVARHALRVLLGLLGRPRDVSRYAFPHPGLSLTHTDHDAVAAAAFGPVTRGVGVDLEPVRTEARLSAARFFLSEPEQNWLAGLTPDVRAAEYVRLWTVKEAVFKSDPANSGTLLRDYLTLDPAARAGIARRPGSEHRFGYTCGLLGRGLHMSVAVALDRAGEQGEPPEDAYHLRSDMPATFDLVAERISETLRTPREKLTEDTTLDELAADSFMLVEMAVDLQEEFDSTFSQADLRQVVTLGQLVDLLNAPPSGTAGGMDG